MNHTAALAVGMCVIFLAVIVMTGLARGFAIRRSLLDLPTARSSHGLPTPTGGGLIFASMLVGGMAALALLATPDRSVLSVLVAATLSLGLVGWFDDHKNLTPWLRLAAQMVVAVAVIAVLGPLQTVRIAGIEWSIGHFAWPLTLVWLVWFTNLYNFMDGIDGLAGIHAVISGGVMALWFGYHGDISLVLVCLLMVVSVLGFLVWNWPPAHLFMGDVGSLSLGILLASLAVIGINRYGFSWSAFLVLHGVFLADATITLLRRLFSGERVTQAHRSHFYQRAIQSGLTHRQVTVGIAGATLFLGMFATLEVLDYGSQVIWSACAIALLAVLGTMVVWREARAGSARSA